MQQSKGVFGLSGLLCWKIDFQRLHKTKTLQDDLHISPYNLGKVIFWMPSQAYYYCDHSDVWTANLKCSIRQCCASFFAAIWLQCAVVNNVLSFFTNYCPQTTLNLLDVITLGLIIIIIATIILYVCMITIILIKNWIFPISPKTEAHNLFISEPDGLQTWWTLGRQVQLFINGECLETNRISVSGHSLLTNQS